MSLKNITKRTKKTKTTEELFPHSSFPYRIEHAEKNDNKICWFTHSSHVQKYIDRSQLKAGTYTVDVHPAYASLEPLEIKTEKKVKPKKQQLFADLDTYVKVSEKPKRTRKAATAPVLAPEKPKRTRKAAPVPIEAPPAPSRSARKAPVKASKVTDAPEAPRRRPRSKK